MSSRGYLAYAPFAEHHTEQHSAATKSLGLEVGPARVAAHMRTNRLHGQRAVSGRAPVATPAGAWVCSSMVAKCNRSEERRVGNEGSTRGHQQEDCRDKLRLWLEW